MCGIAGYFGTQQVDEARAAACLRLMQRRGPDASGSYRRSAGDRNLLLLHSRLSIIDLDERANQPLRCDDSVLAYNGEVYNYLELRQELKRDGCAFTTESDTEVLARALRELGQHDQHVFDIEAHILEILKQ